MSPQTASGPQRRARTGSRAPADLVRRVPLHEEPFVLRVEAAVPDLDLVAWLSEHRDGVLADLDRYGAVLLRGFEVDGPTGFGAAARALTPRLLDYLERGQGVHLHRVQRRPVDPAAPRDVLRAQLAGQAVLLLRRAGGRRRRHAVGQ
jgi:hypothetical protein